MKIYNYTKIPISILSAVLKYAAKTVGLVLADLNNISIVVTDRYDCSWTYRGRNPIYYTKKRYLKLWGDGTLSEITSGNYSEPWLELNLGSCIFTKRFIGFYDSGRIKNEKVLRDFLEGAENIYKVAVHEFRHILDLRNKEIFDCSKKRHDDRPHEIRANMAMNLAVSRIDKTSKCSEIILNLGVALEEIYGVHKIVKLEKGV